MPNLRFLDRTERCQHLCKKRRDIRTEVLPDGSTPYIQPLDVGIFHSWKDFIKRITEYVLTEKIAVRTHDRNFIIAIDSFILNQFRAVPFQNTWKAAWKNLGFDVEVNTYKRLSEICFSFQNTACSSKNCIFKPLVLCAYCYQVYCLNCSVRKYHRH